MTNEGWVVGGDAGRDRHATLMARAPAAWAARRRGGEETRRRTSAHTRDHTERSITHAAAAS
ncbi:hypothetical protein EYF80_039071 [Liparis tanakae]|uniref:Uncharacterized protein n=1 Tax=Liparis tanakae TaxID=230148 RepID=A0A4Z2GBX8_9TELE|nr:hypothetical protein EYF80_039071 [Liparis tanakae]